MNRETENVLLLLVGISGVMIVVTGTYTRYVKPALMPWLFAGAVLVIALALAAIVADIRRGGPPHLEHAHRSPMLWLLAVPVVVLLFITPPAIGAHAVDTTAAVTPAPVARHPFPPLPPGPVPEVSLPDVLMRMAQDSAGTLDGRRIAVTGFTVDADGRMDLGRVVIICCAADAQLARIRLVGPVPRYAEGTWLRVEGEAIPDQQALRVSTLAEVAPPPNPYAY